MNELQKYGSLELDLVGFTEYEKEPLKKEIREKILEFLGSLKDNNQNFNSLVVSIMMRLVSGIPLSPLTLHENEFTEEFENDPHDKWPGALPFQRNIRYSSIRKDSKGFYNVHEFVGVTDENKDCANGKVVPISKEDQTFVESPILFETNYGVRTGRMFRKAYFTPINGEYNVASPLLIPVRVLFNSENESFIPEYEVEKEIIEEIFKTRPDLTIDWHKS